MNKYKPDSLNVNHILKKEKSLPLYVHRQNDGGN